jgi:hypothetical protein
MGWTPHKKGKLIGRVRGWLSDKHDAEPLNSMRLVHVDAASGNETRVVGRWNAPFPDADIITAQVIAVVEDDADVWGGTQRYALFGHFGSGGNIVESASISQHGTSTDEDKDLNVGPSERANSAGMMSQHMRFTESALRTLAKATSDVIDKLAEENNSLRERAASDDARRIKMFELQEQVMSRMTERRIAEEAAAQDREVKKELIGYGKVIVPLIGNKLAGDKIFPEVMTAQHMALGAFFDSIDSQQWQNMLAALPGPQQLFLNSLLNDYLDSKAKREGTYQGDRPLGDGTNAPQMGNGSGNGRAS